MPTPAVFRNAAFLKRREDQIAASVQRELVAIRKALSDLIQSMPLDAVSTGRQARRMDAIVAQAEQIIRDGYTKLNAAVKSEMIALGRQQGQHAADQLARLAKLDTVELAIPTTHSIRAILTSDPVMGDVMGEWWKEQARSTQRAFRTQMRIGLSRQEGVADLVKRVRGTRTASGRYAGGIMPATARGAEALVRTTVNQVANAAARAAYSADPDISDSYEFVATLDDRTTPECQDADGKTFKYDDPKALIPPLHWNCRSTIVPVINYKKLGLEAPKQERMTYKEWEKAGKPR